MMSIIKIKNEQFIVDVPLMAKQGHVEMDDMEKIDMILSVQKEDVKDLVKEFSYLIPIETKFRLSFLGELISKNFNDEKHKKYAKILMVFDSEFSILYKNKHDNIHELTYLTYFYPN